MWAVMDRSRDATMEMMIVVRVIDYEDREYFFDLVSVSYLYADDYMWTVPHQSKTKDKGCGFCRGILLQGQ